MCICLAVISLLLRMSVNMICCVWIGESIVLPSQISNLIQLSASLDETRVYPVLVFRVGLNDLDPRQGP